MTKQSKRELREQLTKEIEEFKQHKTIALVPPKTNKRRKASSKSAPKNVWRPSPIKSSTKVDSSSPVVRARHDKSKRLECTSPGLARQLASELSQAGHCVQVHGKDVLVRNQKKTKAEADITLQQLLSE